MNKKTMIIVAIFVATILSVVGLISFPQEVRAGGGHTANHHWTDVGYSVPVPMPYEHGGEFVTKLQMCLWSKGHSVAKDGEPGSENHFTEYYGTVSIGSAKKAQSDRGSEPTGEIDKVILELMKECYPIAYQNSQASITPNTNQNSQTSSTSSDCQYSGWTKPEPLEGESNIYVSSPDITNGPKNGGKPCPKPIIINTDKGPQASVESPSKSQEVTTPVDCEVLGWSKWHSIPKSTEFGFDREMREPSKTRGPENGGEPCPDQSFRITNPDQFSQPEQNASSNQGTHSGETVQIYLIQDDPVRYGYQQDVEVIHVRESHGSGRDSCLQGKGLAGAVLGGAAASNIGKGSGRIWATAGGALLGCELVR